ncbi:pentatricopeptide repeat-containing protein At2g17033 [Olea europaea var. sylvestris]|uniref:pentatricopeptide repeat-containing protein At2g17033 n=1 Tax=Olea europaea var. sylvestris TaxID=158386 RepID=UPI000C1D7840|nr:pentatricopeptide repeat-containing protein At2g17033 [Olea europaea var. sylvestris]
MRPMRGHCGLGLTPPPVFCELTKQGHRLISSIATAQDPSASIGLLRKFVASSSKHVALNTLSHLLSPSTYHPRLSSLAFPLYSIIKEESWFSWNTKLEADLIALLYKQERFDEAENLFSEAVTKLGFKERELCNFYCNLVDSHAKQKSEREVMDSCKELKQLILQSSSVYVKRRGYESIIGGFCAIGLPNEAENLIEEMRDMGLKPSLFEIRSLIYGYGRLGSFEDMKRSIVQLENEGFELDIVSCNMVVSSLGAHNKLSDMVSWLKKMRNSGIFPSIRTYNSVLNSCPQITLMVQDLKNLPLSINELVDNLNNDEADLVMELVKSSVLDQAMEWKSSELKLDLHGLHLNSAYLVILQWLDEMQQRFISGNQVAPAEILVVCGSGKHSAVRGESPVKGLAKQIMLRLKCPMRIDRKNIGCLIGKGKVFKEWLCKLPPTEYGSPDDSAKS